MIEAIAETDEELMEKYLEGEELTEEELKAAIRKATIANEIVPCICGSSYKNKGVQEMIRWCCCLLTITIRYSTYNRNKLRW